MSHLKPSASGITSKELTLRYNDVVFLRWLVSVYSSYASVTDVKTSWKASVEALCQLPWGGLCELLELEAEAFQEDVLAQLHLTLHDTVNSKVLEQAICWWTLNRRALVEVFVFKYKNVKPRNACAMGILLMTCMQKYDSIRALMSAYPWWW